MAKLRKKINLGRVEGQIKKLAKLHKCSCKEKNKILKGHGNLNLIKCLCEISRNIKNGNMQVKGKYRDQLVKHRECVRQLCLKSKSYKYKRKLLSQKGGFLSALLAPLLSIAGGLLVSAISKK